MITRFLSCSLSLWIACCVAAPTVGYSQESGTLVEADQNFKRALEIWNDGKSPEAEALLNRALSIRQEQLGPGDPKVAEVIERLGALSFNRGKYTEAEALFRKALDIDVRALGERSAVVAYLMGDVGAALREQGRYSEAQAIVERSLMLRRELLPANDLAIAGGLNNLGRIYLGQRRYSDARQAFQESLRIPFVMAVFLWTAYRFFSATMPASANAPSPAQFVGIAAVFFLIVGFVNLRIVRSRMDKLIEDVLSEFKEMQSA
jgi:tetratricopeptide (TPR) repeat protein